MPVLWFIHTEPALTSHGTPFGVSICACYIPSNSICLRCLTTEFVKASGCHLNAAYWMEKTLQFVCVSCNVTVKNTTQIYLKR